MGKEYKPGAKIQVSTSSDSPNVNTPPFGFKWYQFFNLVSDDGYPSSGLGKVDYLIEELPQPDKTDPGFSR